MGFSWHSLLVSFAQHPKHHAAALLRCVPVKPVAFQPGVVFSIIIPGKRGKRGSEFLVQTAMAPRPCQYLCLFSGPKSSWCNPAPLVFLNLLTFLNALPTSHMPCRFSSWLCWLLAHGQGWCGSMLASRGHRWWVIHWASEPQCPGASPLAPRWPGSQLRATHLRAEPGLDSPQLGRDGECWCYPNSQHLITNKYPWNTWEGLLLQHV